MIRQTLGQVSAEPGGALPVILSKAKNLGAS
jgi:hypothetical protein